MLCFVGIILSNPHNSDELGTIVIPILQMRKLRQWISDLCKVLQLGGRGIAVTPESPHSLSLPLCTRCAGGLVQVNPGKGEPQWKAFVCGWNKKELHCSHISVFPLPPSHPIIMRSWVSFSAVGPWAPSLGAWRPVRKLGGLGRTTHAQTHRQMQPGGPAAWQATARTRSPRESRGRAGGDSAGWAEAW